MSSQQIIYPNCCTCEGKKTLTSFEMDNKIHEKLLCENCVNLIESFESMEVISKAVPA